ncbi:hypothetical protein CEQ90_19755 [Lewinellaceae bacterium SD302]|nr:hypothetical protein CEQ90_19755 [Lewinellaceae bacterium SD302]
MKKALHWLFIQVNVTKNQKIMYLKYVLFLFLGLILNFEISAQYVYENGYFILNDNTRVESLINNKDWNSNPTEFEYKVNDLTEPVLISIENVKEFGVYSSTKYIRDTIEVDISSTNIRTLSKNRNPILREKIVFLNVLIDGPASLYEYRNSGIVQYYFKTDQNQVEHLVFKNYELINDRGRQIKENNRYKQQLSVGLQDGCIQAKSFGRLKYSKSSLSKLITEYNSCNNSSKDAFVIMKDDQNDKFFNLSIRPRINFSTYSLESETNNFSKTEFENDINFSVGFETEFLLPFNNGHWSVLLEPTYQSFQSETEGNNNFTGEVDYKSVEIPIGLRYYLLPDITDSRAFLNLLYVLDIPFNSTLNTNANIGFELGFSSNFAVGAGYQINKRMVVETRYNINRNTLNSTGFWNGSYNKLSIIFGYTIL